MKADTGKNRLMKKEFLIVLGATFFGFLVWAFDSAIDSLFFYEGTFLDLLIFKVPKPELFFRCEVIISFTIFGTLIAFFFTRQKEAEAALREMHRDLETIVEEKTETLKETVKLLSDEVNDRQQAEMELKDNRNMLVAVFNGMSDPLILMDGDMRIKLINKAASEYYGLPEDAFPSDSKCHEILMDSALPCEDCEIPAALKSGQSMQFERKGFADPDRLENVYLYPVKKEEDNSWEILFRIKDITEQRLIEKQVIQNEKMAALGVLISSVAHELNNPIGFISFNLPILRDYVTELIPIIDAHAAGEPEFEIFNMPYADFQNDILKLLDNLEHGSDRIKAFVSNMKTFNQIRFKVEGKWIDIKPLIENMIERNREFLFQQVASFEKTIPDGLPEVWSDPHAIEQILLNLLSNAVHATKNNHSRIVLRVEVRDSWLNHLVLEVEDNGIGMDEKTVEKIFDPFFSMKGPKDGTGLGLYVCQGLVNSLKGRIEVKSEPGKGSLFRVVLPDRDRRNSKRS